MDIFKVFLSMIDEKEVQACLLKPEVLCGSLLSETDKIKQSQIVTNLAKHYYLPESLKQDLLNVEGGLPENVDVDAMVTSYEQALRAQWQAYLTDPESENRPTSVTMPPNYLLKLPEAELNKSLQDSLIKQQYLNALWELNKERMERDEFISQFVSSFSNQTEKSNDEQMETVSLFTQMVGSIGYAVLIVLGTVYSFRLFGGATPGMSAAGGVCGAVLASGSIAEAIIDVSNSLYGKERTAKWLKPILGTVFISLIGGLVMLGTLIDEMSSVLSASTPFAMGRIASKVFTYATMACSLVVGAAYTLTNYVFYRDLQKTARVEAKDSKADEFLKSKTFKNISLGLNLFGGLTGIFFIGILISSLIMPPGLGFALGALIGLAMLVQNHLATLDKLGVLPCKDSLNPLDRLYLYLSSRPAVRRAFSATIAVLYATGMLIFPYAVLTNLSSVLPAAMPSLVPAITGLCLGIVGFIGSLYPTYKYNNDILENTKKGNEVREYLDKQENSPRTSSYHSTVSHLAEADKGDKRHHSTEPVAQIESACSEHRNLSEDLGLGRSNSMSSFFETASEENVVSRCRTPSKADLCIHHPERSEGSAFNA